MNTISRRALRKWGDPDVRYPINQHLIGLLQHRLGVSHERRHLCGEQPLPALPSSPLPASILAQLQAIVGADNVELSDLGRARAAAGSTFLDLLDARMGKLGPLPDAVLAPRSEAELAAILRLCNQERIAVCPVGGRSSVTMGIGSPNGGVALELTRHLNQVLHLDAHNRWARVQPGLFGPAYEAALNDIGLSGGHFPQSFEFSTVGGWVAARGAGQQSTRYGKAEDLVLGLRCMTPTGPIEIAPFERCAMGPDLRQLIAGSEGSLGVLTELTLRVFPRPACVQPVSFLFRSMDAGFDFVRRWVQDESKRPAVCRLSDPEETDVALELDGLAQSFATRSLERLGYRAGQRVLFIGSTEGDGPSAKLAALRGNALALRLGGLPLGGHPYRAWSKRRFFDPYLRDELMDMGILIDTLETTASWSQLPQLWQGVRSVMKRRPNTVAMTHISHAYASGANLYFIFISPMCIGNEVDDYRAYHASIVDAISAHGGALSHHHGIGRMFAERLPAQLGDGAMRVLRAVKRELDPNGIMNPGVLGLP